MEAVAPRSAPRLFEARPGTVATVATLLVLFAYSGAFIQLLPLAATPIAADWKLPATAMATPMAAVLIGSGLGTVLGGAIADTLGRRRSIGASLFLLGFCIAAARFATAPIGLTVPMFAGGPVMGAMYAAAMALVAEVVTDARRPLVISFTVASLPVGLGLCSLAASAILPALGWRAFFDIVALLAIPAFFAFAWFVPESPNFLARSPTRQEEYRRTIARLGLMPVAVDAAQHDGHPRASLFKRFSAVMRANPRVVFGIWGLFCGCYVFGNAILGWLPTALTGLGFSVSFASGALSAWSMASMIGTPLAGWCFLRFGVRRAAAASATLGGLVALGLALVARQGITSEWVVLAILPLGGIASAGAVTALYTLAAEAYPPEVRAVGMGLSDAVGRVGGTVAAFSGIYIITGSGPAVFFGLLCLLMLAVGAYLLWLHPESAPAPAGEG